MATSERIYRNPDRRKRNVGIVAGGLMAVGVVVVAWNLRGPPQMGPDEAVFRTVDALFTAVTARDERLLSQCEQRLHAQRDTGKLPPAAADYLDAVVTKARGGSWAPAAERLYDFMKAQRREGARDHHARTTKGPAVVRAGAKSARD